MPHTCQVFGSRYSQVKSEGPLRIPCIYQESRWLGICLHTPGICGRIWHTHGKIRRYSNRICFISLLKSFLIRCNDKVILNMSVVIFSMSAQIFLFMLELVQSGKLRLGQNTPFLPTSTPHTHSPINSSPTMACPALLSIAIAT